jgi:hypothetical protein
MMMVEKQYTPSNYVCMYVPYELLVSWPEGDRGHMALCD